MAETTPIDLTKESLEKAGIVLSNIKLSKKVYGLKGALDALDEEFKEFLPKKKDPKEFFQLYNRFFYDLKKKSHRYFLTKSIEYAYPEGYENPRLIELNNLKAQIKQIQKDIDSIERNHFYFKNNNCIIKQADNNFLDGIINIEMGGDGGPYYMHSGKKRLITNLDAYAKIKTKLTKTFNDGITDSEFLLAIDPTALDSLPSGPDINLFEDIHTEYFEINIYPRTIAEYENLSVEEFIELGEIDNNTEIEAIQLDRD